MRLQRRRRCRGRLQTECQRRAVLYNIANVYANDGSDVIESTGNGFAAQNDAIARGHLYYNFNPVPTIDDDNNALQQYIIQYGGRVCIYMRKVVYAI